MKLSGVEISPSACLLLLLRVPHSSATFVINKKNGKFPIAVVCRVNRVVRETLPEEGNTMVNWSWMLSYFLSVGCLSFIMPWHILILVRDRLLQYCSPIPSPLSLSISTSLWSSLQVFEKTIASENAGSEFVTVVQWLWYQVLAVVWYQEDCTSAAQRVHVCVWSARYPRVRRCKCIGDVDTAS